MKSYDEKVAALKDAIARDALVHGTNEHIVSKTGTGQEWLFDFRRILLQPQHLDLAAEIFWETYKNKLPFQVGGLEVAAIPLISAIVMKSVQKGTPVNGFFIRKSRKKDGLLKMVEGEVTNEPIILVDDLINSGRTFLRQLEVLEGLGKQVTDIFVFLRYRNLNEYTFVKTKNISLTSIFDLSDFGKKHFEPRVPLPHNNFLVEWCFKSENPNYFYVIPKSAPALDTTRVYFGSDGGNFWALNQKDGSVAWKYKVGWQAHGKSIFSSPVIHNGVVYFGSYDGNMYALDTETGEKKWVFYEADWIGSSPALAPDLNLLFVGFEFGLIKKHGGIAALDMETGGKKWEYSMPKYTHGSPAYLSSKKLVAIGSNDGKLYLFNAKTGKLLWTFQSGGEIKAAPAFDEKRGLVLFGSFDGKLYALDIRTGNVVFAHEARFGIYSTPLVYGNSVYYASLDKRLYSINLDTHELNWSFITSGRIFSSPMEGNGKIYIGSNDGRLYEVDPQTGKETAFFQAVERITNKVAYNSETKRLFLPTFANELYCLERMEAASKRSKK